ncbi:DUF2254 domain-containing protein [Haloglycomyces albus]|uniref:DUF2254 domain-containing protein n=1 Tax=Haloglycomyces albus TaxID=526067 RepID=UPI0004A2A9B3|nr:DUF2254 domain-containing protein [Haloglycomyces albus]
MRIVSAARHRRFSSVREHLRNSFVLAPTVAIVAATVLTGMVWTADGATTQILRESDLDRYIDDLSILIEPAATMVNTVASAMLTFVGVIFSISLVALQMAANSFSQRVLLLFVRSRITKATLSIFLGTFVYSMLITLEFSEYQKDSEVTAIPLFGSIVAIALVFASLLLFVIYVDSTIRLLRLSKVIEHISRDALKTVQFLSRNYEQGREGPEPHFDDEPFILVHNGRSGVLQDINIRRIVHHARKRDVIVDIIPRVGDFITTGTPVARISGRRFPAKQLARCITTGSDRSIYQDVAFGFRQLVDIGAKALSPGVNDPTTAVQVIDRIQELIGKVADESFESVAFTDRTDRVRLITHDQTWTSLVNLAFTEIRTYGSSSPQVTRRLTAALNDLIRVTSDERREPLQRQLDLLRTDVAESVPNADDAEFALIADRQGIG